MSTDDMPKWQQNWVALLESARECKAQDLPLDKTSLCEHAGVDGESDWTYALAQARKKEPGEYAEFCELTGRKTRSNGNDDQVEAAADDEDTEEPLTESDVLQNVIANLEAVDDSARIRIIRTAALFLDIDLTEPKAKKAEAAAPAKRQYKKRRSGRKAARA